MRDYIDLAGRFRPVFLLFCAAWLVAGCASDSQRDMPACSALDTSAATLAASDTAQGAGRSQNARAGSAANQGSLSLKADAPHRYVVKKGDTLWDLAHRFLNNAWHWPQLWAQNSDIDNPNLIYPGETLILVRTMDGRVQLRPASGPEQLRPHIRELPASAAIPTIPESTVHAFLNADRVVTARQLAAAPHIVAFGDRRIAGASGRKTYVRGVAVGDPRRYQIVRKRRPLDDQSRDCRIGTLVTGVGELHIDRYPSATRPRATTDDDANDTKSQAKDVATATITQSQRIATVGDRLLQIQRESLTHGYQPHAPARAVNARIVAVDDDRPTVGQYQVITIDRGRADGLERGSMLTILEPGHQVSDPVSDDSVDLPPDAIGSVMLFRLGAHYAFGLVMQSERTITTGYLVRTPRS